MIRILIFAGAYLLTTVTGAAALGTAALLTDPATPGAVGLARAGAIAPLTASASDWPGVLRAAQDLQADMERVTGRKPAFSTGAVAAAPAVILIGTVGRSPLIDGLIKSGKLNADAIRGQWEAFLIETVEQPLPGVDRALVIAGSD